MTAQLRIKRIAVRSLATVLLVGVTGCTIVDLKVQGPSALRAKSREVVQENGNGRAALLLQKATQSSGDEATRIAALVEAIELTAQARPDSAAQRLNRAATENLVTAMQARAFAPVTLPDGGILTVAGDSPKTLDPRSADDLLAAQALQIEGLRVRNIQEGAGVPYVARFKPASPALRTQAGVPPLAGICEPVTALLRSGKSGPQLVFYRTLSDDDTTIDGRRVKLAADFTAPLAYMLSKGRNRSFDVRALIRTDLNMDQAGLYQFSRYEPGKIPVVLVHGLMSRPETWVPAVNELLGDEKIRERYQFWLFLYPTGLPVWASAAKLREEMDRFRTTFDPRRTNGQLDRMVLAGHSMGGLISGLQIRSGGRHLWEQFMKTPPEQLKLTPQTKERLLRIINFGPRHDVARVVFFATPHRGSELAVNPFAEFFARLIRLPFSIGQRDMATIRQALREDLRELFVAPANSVAFLRARSPLLAAILRLPMRPGVPYHSIIGDRGRGDTPDSSDGVVPYWSSHLDGASTEKIVPSGHGTNENPEGIREFRRILRRHVGLGSGPLSANARD
jgi:pimeloyl-ACP methyl ester carboxylesterase